MSIESTSYANEEIPMAGRLTPIGSASSETEFDRSVNENSALIEEHEKLVTSLAALTRHVAHVQLRLQQVVSAPTTEDRENLLKELHEFASSGIPDVMCQTSIQKNEQIIEAEKFREKEFINDLKQKLDELEHYAAASGSLEGAPTSVTMEKQRILIDQLKDKLHLQLDDESVSKLSSEELRKHVDQAIHQLTNPLKVKENLITQMGTQIRDLEKFIDFLKTDSVTVPTTSTPVPTAKPIESSAPIRQPKPKSNPTPTNHIRNSLVSPIKPENNSSSLTEAMKKFLLLTQLYTFLFLSCGKKPSRKKSYQTTSNPQKDILSKNHYGDVRAKLEIAIDKVINTTRLIYTDDDDSTSSDSEEEYSNLSAIVSVVRQYLAPALRALLEHGLCETGYTTSIVRWGCFSTKSTNHFSTTSDERMHVWKLFLKYYEMKNGDEFADSPAYKLSQSFALDVIGGRPISLKQHLLAGIDTVNKLHEKHARPLDSCFKSFICYALNEKKLVPFLRLILKTASLVENYYQPWSYTKQTGFNDALHSLDRLSTMNFQLPIDLSVRRFMNNRDLIE